MQRSTCLDELASLIVEIPLEHPRVAIDGVDGAGKTTLADELVPLINVAGRSVIRASIDGFHKPKAQRYRRGPDSPEGYFLDSFEYEDLKTMLLDPLGPGGGDRYRTAVFDFRTDEPVKAPLRTAKPAEILLFDGVFLMRPELEGSWDLTIWVDAPFEVAVERAINRDAPHGAEATEIRGRYDRRYVPGQRIYFERCQPAERADVFLSNVDVMNPTLKYRRPGKAV